MADPNLPATHRSLQARLGAYSSWARTSNPSARTAPGRQAFLARFEREVDLDGTLDPAERSRRAERARKAYYARLQLLSARSRAKAKAARQRADELDAEATAADAELAANPPGEGGAA